MLSSFIFRYDPLRIPINLKGSRSSPRKKRSITEKDTTWNLKGSFQLFSWHISNSPHQLPTLHPIYSLVLCHHTDALNPSTFSLQTYQGKEVAQSPGLLVHILHLWNEHPILLPGVCREELSAHLESQELQHQPPPDKQLNMKNSTTVSTSSGKKIFTLYVDVNSIHTYFLLELVPCPMDSSSLFHCCPSY